MTDVLSIDAVAKAMAEEVIAACSARFGAEATSAPSDAPADEGWVLTVPVSGAVTGRISIWIDKASASACTRALAGQADVTDEAIGDLLSAIVQDATTAVLARPACAGIVIGGSKVTVGRPPVGSRGFFVAAPNTASCLWAIGIDWPAKNTLGADERLGAVLGVDLPLVVRFGRTSMPLRQVAELGPGSVIDLARSPDEPVDVMVGDRLIARGEVVVVGGNYGVRITALTAGEPAASH